MITFTEYVKKLEEADKLNKLLERKITYRKVAIRKKLAEKASGFAHRDFEVACLNDSVLNRLEYEKNRLEQSTRFLYENAEIAPAENEVTSVE